MNLEKFTQKAQMAIASSQEYAVRFDNQEIDAEHLNYSLVRCGAICQGY
jgi:ATP-dependent Clp protease ATP-binding subunit ClpB